MPYHIGRQQENRQIENPAESLFNRFFPAQSPALATAQGFRGRQWRDGGFAPW